MIASIVNYARVYEKRGCKRDGTAILCSYLFIDDSMRSRAAKRSRSVAAIGKTYPTIQPNVQGVKR